MPSSSGGWQIRGTKHCRTFQGLGLYSCRLNSRGSCAGCARSDVVQRRVKALGACSSAGLLAFVLCGPAQAVGVTQGTGTASGGTPAARTGGDAQLLAAVERQLKISPDDPALLIEHGQLLWQAGRGPEALSTFRRAVTLAPQSAAAHNNVAAVLAAQGRLDEARQSLEAGLRTHGAYATIHENLGKIHAQLAAEAYRRALNPDKSGKVAPLPAPQLALVSFDRPPSR